MRQPSTVVSFLSFDGVQSPPASVPSPRAGRPTDQPALGRPGRSGRRIAPGSAMTKSYQKRRPSAPCRDCQKRRALKRSILPRSNRTLVRRSERADATARHETPRSWLGCTVRVAASVAWLNWLVAVADLCARAWHACVVTQRGLLFGERARRARPRVHGRQSPLHRWRCVTGRTRHHVSQPHNPPHNHGHSPRRPSAALRRARVLS